jgi:hypothetical protein
MLRITDRRGSTLIIVMLLVSLMLMAITGAFVRTSAERRNALDAAAQVDAFSLAQDGIDKYIALVTSIPSSLPDSQTFTLTGGRAVVTLRYLRVSASDTTLVLISRGENSATNKYSSDAAVASRTVTQLVRWTGGSIELPGGFTSLSGFQLNGNAANISGVDACKTAPAPLASIPGLAVPSISASDTLPDYSGKSGPIQGSPNGVAVQIGTPGTTGTAKDSVNIDWAGITARTAITPTYYYKTTAPTQGSWPTTAQLSGTHWPVTFVQGDLSLPSDGQGILIVTGNMTVNGNNTWNGIVLIGGIITSNGNNTFYGAIMTGLNVITGGTVGQDALGNGNKIFQYNSCDVANALKPFGSWIRLANAKTDNYPLY